MQRYAKLLPVLLWILFPASGGVGAVIHPRTDMGIPAAATANVLAGEGLSTLANGAALAIAFGRGDASSARSASPEPGPWVDAGAFGARGDGSTDDTSALRAALVAASGGVLYLARGIYLVTDSLVVPSGTEVRGAGESAAVIKHGPGLARAPLVVPGTSADVVLSELAIDGNQPENSSFESEELSIARGARDVLVRRVRIFNMNKIGIATEGTRVWILDSVIIGVGNRTTSPAAMGIWAGPASRELTVSRCLIRNMRVNAIFVGGGRQNVISSNLLVGNHTQTSPVGGGQVDVTENARDTLIIGNTVLAGGGSRTSGLELDASTGTMVVGNLVADQAIYGIILQSGSGFTVANNLIKNSGTPATSTPAILVAAGVGGFTIIGNRAFDDRESKTQSWGLEIATGPSDFYTVVANDFRQNINDAGIRDGGIGRNKYLWGNLPVAAPVTVFGTPYQWTGGSGVALLSSTSTEYLAVSGTAAPTSAEVTAQTLVAADLQVEEFRVTLSAAPGSEKRRTFTIKRNGLPTPATVSLADGNRSAAWVGAVPFTSGDRITVESTVGERPTAAILWFGIRARDRVP